MYLKLTMLFLLIGFVVGLPYFLKKYGQFGKGRQAIDITKASGSSSFNRKS
jgi:flagellar biogenesis protein FliO